MASPAPTAAPTTPAPTPTTQEPQLDLQVPIFSYAKATNIAEYIGKIFEYALVIIIPIGIIVIMWGGFLWIFAGGNPPVIKLAKSYISSAVLGLILAALSYAILSFIGLTTLTVPSIQYVAAEEGGDMPSLIPLNFDVEESTPGSIDCNKTGGSGAFGGLANGAQGKVTYRMGGKPWTKAPYDPGAEKMSCGGKPCYPFCPEGQMCLDCSGFMSWLYLCAGLKSPDSFTGSIFGTNCQCSNPTPAGSVGKSEKITSYDDTHV
ncbi:MAG: hypothetical protein NT116_01535, partial [Candidatus Parcubacteria bacterium]|nr:hypothetical protein [Candidatus Parcubacteria bacterium]